MQKIEYSSTALSTIDKKPLRISTLKTTTMVTLQQSWKSPITPKDYQLYVFALTEMKYVRNQVWLKQLLNSEIDLKRFDCIIQDLNAEITNFDIGKLYHDVRIDNSFSKSFIDLQNYMYKIGFNDSDVELSLLKTIIVKWNLMIEDITESSGES